MKIRGSFKLEAAKCCPFADCAQRERNMVDLIFGVLIAGFLIGLLLYLYRAARDGKIPPFPERSEEEPDDDRPQAERGPSKQFKSGGGGDFGGSGADGKF